jgi:hypothetical protein
MPDNGGGHVALFIDWDNLAISTAADHGGAIPDLRRIVQVAQAYGTVLLARAYAEWGITSDRLAVYRAGVEPVYAPTFRFEADIPGQPSRGKSLADPCLVADCIDALHLHESLTHFVLVSGDKDLIPIVRLAQMRGKRVVVIGPDLVAAVLRDMADEYVPYRSLVGGAAAIAASATVRAEAAELGRRRRRRGRGGAAGHAEGEPTTPAAEEPEPPARHERRERRPFQDRAGVFRAPAEEPREPAHPEDEPEDEPEIAPPPPRRREAPRREPVVDEPGGAEPPRVEPPAPRYEPAPRPSRAYQPTPPPPAPPPSSAPEVEERPVETRAPAPAPAPVSADASAAEVDELWGHIRAILRERTNTGRPRLRATNLKDYLLARVPGFNEQRFGFARFADLLRQAETLGVLVSTDVGPVQWISLPEVEGITGSAPAAAPTPLPGAPEVPALPPAEPTVAPSTEASESSSGAVVAAAVDLDEAVALIVELRHRSRLLTQSLVLSNLGALVTARSPETPADEGARALVDRLVDLGVLRVDREPQEVDLNGAKHRVRLTHLVDDSAVVQRAEESWRRQNPASDAPAAAETSDEAASRGRSRRGSRGGSRRGRGGAAAEASSEAAETAAGSEGPAPAAEASSEAAPSAAEGTSAEGRRGSRRGRGRGGERGAAASQAETTGPAGDADASAANAADAGAPGGVEQVYPFLVEAVRAGIAPGKDTAGAAGVKSRLTAVVPEFNERTYGFSKFKDFLLAAEKAGLVRVETAGAATRVGLPG